MPSSLGLGIIHMGVPREILAAGLKDVPVSSRRSGWFCEVSVYTDPVSWASRAH